MERSGNDWLRELVTQRPAAGLLLLYSGLGLLQVTWRFLSSWLEARRMWKMLEPVPSARFVDGGIFGALPDLVRNFHRLNDWRMESCLGLPVCKLPFIRFDLQGVAVMVNDPLCIRHFLKDAFDKYTKMTSDQDMVVVYMQEFLGDGIFMALHGGGAPDGGRSWSLQRKIAASIFTRGQFNGLMQEVFQAKSERLCEELAKQAAAGRPVDMQCQVFNFTMDSVMRIFFGEESDTLGGAPHKYGQAYDEAHHCFFSYALKAAGFMVMTRLFLPWPFGGYNGLSWRLHAALSPTCRRFRAAVRTLDQESARIIRACRADPALGSRRDLLALFVQAEEQQRFSTQFLRDVVLNFVIAGRDTTASLLSWVLFELAQNPAVQERLCAEIDAKAPAGRGELTFKSLSHTELPYLHGVLYEGLRLWPPVPFDIKVSVEDDVFPNGVKVPRGCKVAFLPYSLGRDPEKWPEPLAFRPERWIPFSQPAPHEFPVFQAGPRICLGMDMAIFEAKVVLCNLLRRFTFELVPGEAEKITYTVKLTMNISNSKGQEGGSEQLWMHVCPRQQS